MSAPRTGKGAAGCPICGQPVVTSHRPFCSRRCADIDLAHWLGGTYAIPAADDSDDSESYPPAEEDDED